MARSFRNSEITPGEVNEHSIATNPALTAAADLILRLTTSPHLVSLAASYGYIERETAATERLADLKKVANANWDFRSGLERQDVTGVTATSDDMSELVFAAAHELGMVDDSHTKKTHHDYVNILGGANLSPLLRVKYAKAEIDRAAAATPPNLVLLGSARGLSATEKIKTSGYAPGARDEFDLMNGAVETVFDASPIAEDTIDIKNTGAKEPEKGKWKVRYYDNNGIRILSLSAPQVEGTRRVNTADTYRFLKAIVGLDMLDGASILNVTTAHFGAFQHADALRLLGIPARAEIETIGYGALYAGSERKPHELLQEINSAYNQATLLAETVPELLAI